jgi:nucleoside-diphosphate-sugar epimerase
MIFNKKTILITGSSGFLGNHLLKYLLISNHKLNKIIGIDIKNNNFKNRIFFFYNCSLINIGKLRAIIKSNNPDIIVHLAATTNLDLKDLNSYKSNHIGTKNLITIIKEQNKKIKLIITSTMLVNHKDSNSLVGYEPTTVYGKSKTIMERSLRSSSNQNFSWCILRPVTIWGDGLGNHFKTFLFLVSKKFFFCIKDCKIYKSFSYVKNAAFQIGKIIESNPKNFNRKVFYLSDYYPIEINSWADQIFELFHNNNQKNLRVNIKLLKFLSMVGDFFVKLGFYKFYMQSRRLKNMTTNYVVNNNKLERITGRLPWNLDQATKNFVDCYKKNISK